jgi:spore germination protein GerM
MRVLGYPLTGLTEAHGYPAQYFEKGRIEDHRGEAAGQARSSPDSSAHPWAFMYGRLTVELMESYPQGRVSDTSVTYGDLVEAASPGNRQAPPPGFTGGTKGVHDGMFVPYDAKLRSAPGHVVAPYFWAYMNRTELFPGGWLHDLGLPMTGVLTATVTKQGDERTVFMQAFERALFTYDMRNPAGWQVEKGNIGADAARDLVAPPPTTGEQIELPAEGARVMLPLHILAYVGEPGEQLTAELRWQDNTRLRNTVTVLTGADGMGVVVANLDWVNALAPPVPATQPATLTLSAPLGGILASRQVTVVSPDDPNTQEIKLYWTVSGTEIVQPQTRRVLRSSSIGATALEELLWGPPAISQVGFGTSLPTPEQVLTYPGRQPDWGPRITLRKLTIDNGIATADFSKELRAYGGGSLRVKMIRDQITQTLQQFPTVREVRIAVEGETEGVLEP